MPGVPGRPVKGDDSTEYTLSVVLSVGYTGGYDTLNGFKVWVCKAKTCGANPLNDNTWEAVCNSRVKNENPGIGKSGSDIEECIFSEVIPAPKLSAGTDYKMVIRNLIPRQNYRWIHCFVSISMRNSACPHVWLCWFEL